MARFLITFSSDEVATNGKPLQEVRSTEVERLKKLGTDKLTDEEVTQGVANVIPNKRDMEKRCLRTILASAFKEEKELAGINCIMTLSKELEDSEESLLVDKAEFEKYIRKQAPIIEKEPWMINLIELYRQIESPQEEPPVSLPVTDDKTDK